MFDILTHRIRIVIFKVFLKYIVIFFFQCHLLLTIKNKNNR